MKRQTKIIGASSLTIIVLAGGLAVIKQTDSNQAEQSIEESPHKQHTLSRRASKNAQHAEPRRRSKRSGQQAVMSDQDVESLIEKQLSLTSSRESIQQGMLEKERQRQTQELDNQQTPLLAAIGDLTDEQQEKIRTLLGDAQPKLQALAGGAGYTYTGSMDHRSLAEQKNVTEGLSEILDAGQYQNYVSYAENLKQNRIEAEATRAYGQALRRVIGVDPQQKQLIYDYLHARQASYEEESGTNERNELDSQLEALQQSLKNALNESQLRQLGLTTKQLSTITP